MRRLERLGAIRDKRVARIAYVDPKIGARSVREIEPLGLVCLVAAWWVVAYCRVRKDARAFRVDAIDRWEDTRRSFEPRTGLSFIDVVAHDAHLAPRLFGS
jgi:predicted DNA-binding transcriptional regulator YafY